MIKKIDRSIVVYRIFSRLLLLAVFLLAFFLRTVGINWDDGQHLNPDERFLTMVLDAMKWPGWNKFYSSQESTLNPVNVGHNFFVYGTLPLFINKLVATTIGDGNYSGYLIVGRALSALFDTGTVVVVFILAKLFWRMYTKNNEEKEVFLVGLVAAFFYAVAVIPIQNSHFFIVDTFANFFGALTLYYLLLIADKGISFVRVIALASVYGMALACKLSLGLVAPTFGIVALVCIYRDKHLGIKKIILKYLLCLIAFLCVFYLVFRTAMPYAFRDGSVFSLDERFRENSRTVSQMVKGFVDMPPSIQWAGTNAFWPVQEISLWGWGIVTGFVLFLFFGYFITKSLVEKNIISFIFLSLFFVPFLYQSTLLAKAQRYFLSSYLLLSIIMAVTFVLRRKELFVKLLFIITSVNSLVWSVMFVSIYTRDHSRIAASKWIYKTIPLGSAIAWEHWDDPLPLLIEGHNGGEFRGIELPMYDPDSQEKVNMVVERLSRADYIVLSSNRLYGSISKMPTRYPMTSLYYELLFSNKLGFVKLEEFTSYPSFFGYKVNDDMSEEPFTVYDHPKVTVFKKSEDFNGEMLRKMLLEAKIDEAKFSLAKDVIPVGWDLIYGK